MYWLTVSLSWLHCLHAVLRAFPRYWYLITWTPLFPGQGWERRYVLACWRLGGRAPYQFSSSVLRSAFITTIPKTRYLFVHDPRPPNLVASHVSIQDIHRGPEAASFLRGPIFSVL